MTNLVARPSSGRGSRRRAQLVSAGVALLAEQGWSAVTTRAVADRAGANLGLIHYHFGGLAGLRLEIARQAAEEVIGPVVAGFLEAADEREALDTLRRLLPETAADPRVTRLAAELMTEGFRDPALGEMSRTALRAAREHLVVRLEQLRPDWSASRRTGAAILTVAMLDGLMLHCLLDPEMEIDAALTALADLMGVRR